jgi:hypothetical protein
MTEQSYRYDRDVWTAAEAGAHCRAHDGAFEAARQAAESEADMATEEPGLRQRHNLCRGTRRRLPLG